MISIIVAASTNNVIGRNGELPWRLSEDLKHFKQTTMDKAILMGRKTWQAIGRPLPGRQNIVITRNPGFEAVGADVCTSLTAAMDVSTSGEIMVIGGGQLYTLALPLAQRMVLTMIDIEPDADTWFPEWKDQEWQQTEERHFPADEKNCLAYRILELQRISP